MSTQAVELQTGYEDVLRDVFDNGTLKGDRTGTGTLSVAGRTIRYDLSKGFPLITTKWVNFRWVALELLWFLSGDSNIRPLLENGVSIWSEWPLKRYLQKTEQAVPEVDSKEWKEQKGAFEKRILEDEAFALEYGDLGPVYGVQWRHWPDGKDGEIDQIENVVNQLKTNPDSRRMVVSAWNPTYLSQMALEPCHFAFQFYVADRKLSCIVSQRSCDMFLGVPFNLASYALLTHMLAQQCDLEVGDLVWTGGDVHIYTNHLEQVELQLSREPRPLPTLSLVGKPSSIFEYSMENFEIVGYDSHPFIRGAVSV